MSLPEASPEVKPAVEARPLSRSERFLFGLLVAFVLILGWGRIQLDAGVLHFSIGGSAGAIFRIMLAAYVVVRLVNPWPKEITFYRDPMIVLYLVAFASVGWNVHHDVRQVVSILMPGFVAYLMTRYLLERDFEHTAPTLLRATVLALVLVVPHLVMQEPSVLLHFNQLDAPEEHHTHIAMRLVMAMPMIIALMVVDERFKKWWPILLIPSVLGLVIAGSRIGWMALVVIGLYGFLSSRQVSMKRAFAIASVLVVVLALAFPSARHNFMSLASINTENNYLRRLVIYRTDLQLIALYPVLGVGFSGDTFTETAKTVEPTFYWEHPHDFVLQIMVYLGLPGLLALGLLLAAEIRALKILRDQGPLLQGTIGAIIGFFVMNVAETVLSSERVTFFVSVMVALLLAWARHPAGLHLEAPEDRGDAGLTPGRSESKRA